MTRYIIEDTDEGFKLTVGGYGDPRREFIETYGHGPIERLYVEVVKTADELRARQRESE